MIDNSLNGIELTSSINNMNKLLSILLNQPLHNRSSS